MQTDLLQLADEWGPEKVLVVSDTRTGMRGVLVIDNTARGIGKGGTRMSPTVTVAEIARLARTMTWKWAAVDLFHGGAKAGILGDPNSPHKEAILRAFARALRNEVPEEYLFGLDMGLNERDAAVLADELGSLGASTGLPRALGGLPYDQLGVTGFGVAEAADAAAEHIGLKIAGKRVAIQGFGAVGTAAATRFLELGASVVAVATAGGTVSDPNGLDISRLQSLREHFGDDCVREYPAGDLSTDVLSVDADILVPAAREDTISDKVATETSVSLIVEGANLPTSPSSRSILKQRGITVVPDFIANAGGIVAAAHSTDSRNSPFVVNEENVFTMISEKLRANTTQVLQASQEEETTSHEAAFALAADRVREAMALRRRLPFD
ncbi:Glu/Leu/Phe/Val family dehydrogenase [Gulosibacter molinativorax]|uniref:Glutamate dehydrogenase n=1 Tax=Gulosibacter molinativorax TaxID=256821 RepID=A0ABT7C7L0_9MICO|nr:Glu/Leu/Phe/Val dehydrogenase dimerization domain-containing protein [Gulosibacter molinativorax]MDJ1371169.1 Glu/Leu/Phe/Val dehydrogenase [Gulosibacter molinativorax]QUY62985.1 Glutamate dehydrogenase [Gulosibacter molinativorax]